MTLTMYIIHVVTVLVVVHASTDQPPPTLSLSHTHTVCCAIRYALHRGSPEVVLVPPGEERVAIG